MCISALVKLHPAAKCPSRAIGAGTRVGALAQVAASAKIGRNCDIGEGAVIEDGVRVGDNVSVGAGARLCKGAVIEPGGIGIGHAAIVAPGSVVTQDLPARAVAEGDPPRVTCYSGAQELADPAGPGGDKVALPDDFPARLLRLQAKSNRRGLLTVGSFPESLPFRPRRWFTVSGVPAGSWRGAHAHREGQQVMFAASGRMLVALDDGVSRVVVPLTSPAVAIHTLPGAWNLFFGHTADAVLVVLASHDYDPADYISDYEELLRIRRARAEEG